MQYSAKEQETIKRYLLGRVAQEEQAQLEERLLGDTDFYEELLITEDELVDRYLTNQLSEAERGDFEANFLVAPDRMQKLRFARSLKRYVNDSSFARSVEEVEAVDLPEPVSDVADRHPKRRITFWSLSSRKPLLGFSLAAAVLFVVIGVSWLALKNRTPLPTSEPGKVLTVVLTPGLTRDGSASQRTTVPSNTDTVQLWLQLAATDYAKYRAVMLTDAGSEIWAEDNLTPKTQPEGTFVAAEIPARLVSPGDYRIKLSRRLGDGALEDVATYSFNVRR